MPTYCHRSVTHDLTAASPRKHFWLSYWVTCYLIVKLFFFSFFPLPCCVSFRAGLLRLSRTLLRLLLLSSVVKPPPAASPSLWRLRPRLPSICVSPPLHSPHQPVRIIQIFPLAAFWSFHGSRDLLHKSCRAGSGGASRRGREWVRRGETQSALFFFFFVFFFFFPLLTGLFFLPMAALADQRLVPDSESKEAPGCGWRRAPGSRLQPNSPAAAEGRDGE